MRYEVTTTYYDRTTRKETRHVHGIVEADSVDAAAELGRSQYGAAGCKLLAMANNEFNAKRAIKVKQIV